jgi:hypothetical protein
MKLKRQQQESERLKRQQQESERLSRLLIEPVPIEPVPMIGEDIRAIRAKQFQAQKQRQQKQELKFKRQQQEAERLSREVIAPAPVPAPTPVPLIGEDLRTLYAKRLQAQREREAIIEKERQQKQRAEKQQQEALYKTEHQQQERQKRQRQEHETYENRTRDNCEKDLDKLIKIVTSMKDSNYPELDRQLDVFRSTLRNCVEHYSERNYIIILQKIVEQLGEALAQINMRHNVTNPFERKMISSISGKIKEISELVGMKSPVIDVNVEMETSGDEELARRLAMEGEGI